MKASAVRLCLAGCVAAGSVVCGIQGQAPRDDGHDLTRLADKYGTDKGSTVHNYTEVYQYFFQPMRNDARKVFEIGVASGSSLFMFRDYFPKAVIYGIDIEDSHRLDSPRIKTFVADQANRKQLQQFVDAHGSDFDLILDDGGHTMEQQQVSFGYFFAHVKPGGYYVIEDVHTSLMVPGWGIDEDQKNTTLAMIENFVRTGTIVSKHMTAAEARYATDHIRYCNLLKGADLHSITCLLKKK